MLLSWHKNNNFLDLWLNLNFQLEQKDIYKKTFVTYIRQIYSNGLLKLKIWIYFLFMFLYTRNFVYEFYWDIL